MAPPKRAGKDYKQDEIREYVEMETRETAEVVTHVEWLRAEHMFGERFDVWDVRTDKDRYWVISNLTNLYSQSDFKSLDQAMTYHFGVRMVLSSRSSKHAPSDEAQHEAVTAWRLFEQAAEQLDEAEEAEDYQSVGMRCRETLLAFVQEVARQDLPLPDSGRPKAADFTGWTEFLADNLASGSTNERLRSLLKTSGEEVWQYVNWLTHAKNANRLHGETAVDAVRETMTLFTPLTARARHKVPERCPQCRSYRVTYYWRSEVLTVRACDTCGWEEHITGASNTD